MQKLLKSVLTVLLAVLLAAVLFWCYGILRREIRKNLVTPTPTPQVTPTPTPRNTTEKAVTPTPPFPYTATVRERLAVRGGPGEEFSRLRYLEQGESVQVLDLVRAADGGTWARIANGFVNSRYLSKK